LTKKEGWIKFSLDVTNRDSWLAEFKNAGFETEQRKKSDNGRTRLKEVTTDLIAANESLVKRFFTSAYDLWRARTGLR
jgi:hypothetical protein